MGIIINTAIENEIKKVLNQVNDEGDRGKLRSTSDWTNRIKELLGNLGEILNFEVCTSGIADKFEPEWLYDLVWYLEKQNRLIKVPLVMESEWGMASDIKYDFEKLLVSNAELRLMICQVRPEQKDELKEYFIDAVKKYEYLNKGDKFLVAIFEDYGSERFEFLSIVKE